MAVSMCMYPYLHPYIGMYIASARMCRGERHCIAPDNCIETSLLVWGGAMQLSGVDCVCITYVYKRTKRTLRTAHVFTMGHFYYVI